MKNRNLLYLYLVLLSYGGTVFVVPGFNLSGGEVQAGQSPDSSWSVLLESLPLFQNPTHGLEGVQLRGCEEEQKVPLCLDEFLTFLQSAEKNPEAFPKKNLRALWDHFLDQWLALLPILPGQKGAFFVEDMNGFGDLLFALKSMQKLRRELPEIPFILVTNGEDPLNKIRSLSRGEESIGLGVESASMAQFPPHMLDHTLRIFAPTPFLHEESVDEKIGVQSDGSPTRSGSGNSAMGKVTSVQIREYGFGNDLASQSRLYSAGLGRTELGIFLDQDLDEFSRLDEEEQKRIRPRLLEQLENKELKKMLELTGGSSLYFGHAHRPQSRSHFLNIVTAYHPEATGGMDVVMRLPLDEKNLDLKAMGEKGYSAIHFYKKKGEAKGKGNPQGNPQENPQENKEALVRVGEIILSPGGDPGKVIRIIDPFPLAHRDMKILLKASGPLVLTTGDQSMGETISSGKFPVYEIMGYKENFFQDFVRLSPSPSLAQAIKEASIPAKNFSLGSYRQAANFFRDPQWKNSLQELTTQIKRDFDLGRRLIMKVRRELVLRSYPELAEQVKRMEEILLEKPEAKKPRLPKGMVPPAGHVPEEVLSPFQVLFDGLQVLWQRMEQLGISRNKFFREECANLVRQHLVRNLIQRYQKMPF